MQEIKRRRNQLILIRKWHLFCFANGQIVYKETSLLEWTTWGITLERKDILDKKGRPSLQCQVWKSLSNYLTIAKLYNLLCRIVEAVAMGMELRSANCSKMYGHFSAYPNQSSSNAIGPAEKQRLEKKKRQQCNVVVSLETEIKLKSKEGTHNTSCKIKDEVRWWFLYV